MAKRILKRKRTFKRKRRSMKKSFKKAPPRYNKVATLNENTNEFEGVTKYVKYNKPMGI